MKSKRTSLSTYERIWETVQKIPRGRVATYGSIAKASGFPGQARLVGYALHNVPEVISIPWQRVINGRGMISFPVGSRHYKEQRRLLEKEGVRFKGERIDLAVFGWPYPHD